MTRAIIYTRQSLTADASESASLAFQERECRLWYRVWGIAFWVTLGVIVVTRGGAWVLERLGW